MGFFCFELIGCGLALFALTCLCWVLFGFSLFDLGVVLGGLFVLLGVLCLFDSARNWCLVCLIERGLDN